MGDRPKTRVDKYGNVLADGPMSANLPEGPNSDSLQGRRSGVVARVKKKNPRQPQASQDFSQAEDINALFQGLRQQGTPQGVRKPIVRRGLSGQELDANGQDPGRGMAWFDRNNSEAQVNERQARMSRDDARRYAQINQQGSAAVAERKALQGMGGAPFQQGNPNLVKGNDGYMDLFGPGGKIVGSTRPQNRVQGFGDPSNTNLEAQRASQGMQNEFQQNFRAGNAPGAMPPNAGPQFIQQSPPQPRGDFLTPGGGGGSAVGGPPAQGAPAGGTPRRGGIAPVDWMSGLDTSYTPKFTMPARQPAPPPLSDAQAFPPAPPLPYLNPLPQGFGNPTPPQQPFGVTNGVANVRGVLPRVGQGIEEFGADLSDLWASLMGEPQLAYERFKQAQEQYARNQYLQGLR